jgi:hypothetical protein
MKRTFSVLMLAVLAASGCMTLPLTQLPPPANETPLPPAPPAVLPEEVTTENAQEMLVALSREVERDAAFGSPSPPPADPAKH